MGKFHRFVDPTYYLFAGESFPAVAGGTGTIGLNTYDRANVVSGGSGSGGSAPADGQKGSGVNNYTYFVGFGDDATSLNTNRGFRAAFESLDTLDNILRESLPKHATVTGPSPVSDAIVIPGDVWCGNAGDTADRLVAAYQASGFPLVNGTTAVYPIDIDNGTVGSSVVGTGWVSSPTVRFNVPVTQAYEIVYGARTTLARVSEIEQGAWWGQDIESINLSHVTFGVFRHGLDEMYRRATTPTTPSPLLNTPGSGAVIRRDGQALTVLEPDVAYTAGPYPDPFLASFKTVKESTGTTTAQPDKDGAIGYLSVTSFRNSFEAGDPGTSLYNYAGLVQRSVDTDDYGGVGLTTTRVPAGASATINPTGSPAGTLRLTSTAHYWYKVFGVDKKTALRSNVDLIQITRSTGEKRLVRVSDAVAGATQLDVVVAAVAGSSLPVNEAVTVVLYQPTFSTTNTSTMLRALSFATNGTQTSSTQSMTQPALSVFGASDTDWGFTGRIPAIAWGGANRTSGLEVTKGILHADGGVTAQSIFADLHSAPFQQYLVSTNTTINLRALTKGDVSKTSMTAQVLVPSAATGAITLGINFLGVNVANIVDTGTRFTLVLDIQSSTVDLTLNFGASGVAFLFSGTQNVVPKNTKAYYLFEAICANVPATIAANSLAFVMKRTDYLVP